MFRILARSYAFNSVQTEMPPLTTYFPWSPASYHPPDTSSVWSQPGQTLPRMSGPEKHVALSGVWPAGRARSA